MSERPSVIFTCLNCKQQNPFFNESWLDFLGRYKGPYASEQVRWVQHVQISKSFIIFNAISILYANALPSLIHQRRRYASNATKPAQQCPKTPLLTKPSCQFIKVIPSERFVNVRLFSYTLLTRIRHRHPSHAMIILLVNA